MICQCACCRSREVCDLRVGVLSVMRGMCLVLILDVFSSACCCWGLRAVGHERYVFGDDSRCCSLALGCCVLSTLEFAFL